MVCKWIRYYGNYCFTTECGHLQGLNIRPKQKTCFCGRRIERYIQDSFSNYNLVTNVAVKNGTAYYYTEQ